MKRDTCPDPVMLERLLLGDLPGAEYESLDEHLLNCDVCASRAETIAASDEVTEAIRTRRTFADEEDVLSGVIERGKQLSSKARTVQPEETLTVEVKQANRDSPASADGNVEETLDFLQPAERPDEIGRLGGYRVLQLIGVGGMGVVFLAEDPKLERLVALKAMKPQVSTSKSAKDRFLREAKATASIEHDSIVQIYQVGEDQNVPFIAMRYLRGESLDSRLKRQQRLDPLQLVRLGRQIATGLAAAHKQGLIHRDIKPENIWIEEETGRAKILDFGLVRSACDDAGLTQSGTVLGTPKYMAPEQAQGQEVDHRGDLFSLGSVLYHLASGRPPFKGKSLTAVLIAVAHEEAEPIQQLCPRLNDRLGHLIMRLLKKGIDERPQSAADVANELAEIEKELQVQEAELVEKRKGPAIAETVTAAKAVPQALQTNRHSKNQKPLIGSVVAIAALGIVLVLWAAGVLFKVETPNGTLVVKVTGDDFASTIQGKSVIIQNLKTKDQITIDLSEPQLKKGLPPGDYRFLLATESGLRTRTNRFTIASGKDEKVEVWWEPITSGSVPAAAPTAGAFHEEQPPAAIAPFTADEAGQHQEAWAQHLGVPVEITNSLGMKFRVIPPGEFVMGSSEEEIAASLQQVNELDHDFKKTVRAQGPVHTVILTKPIAAGVHEVTRALFGRFVNATGYKTDVEKSGAGGVVFIKGQGYVKSLKYIWSSDLSDLHPDTPQPADQPVVNVTWNDAVAFCEWLSEQEGVKYRLATEAEWEFFCRAGSTSKFGFGEDESQFAEFGWCQITSVQSVGQKKPNRFGLHDTHGNVWEWCLDRFVPYTPKRAVDPTHSPGETHVVRGGCFNFTPLYGSSAWRQQWPIDASSFNAGFRVVRTFENHPPKQAPTIAPFDAEEAKRH